MNNYYLPGRYRRYGTLTLECPYGGTHDWQSSYENSPRF
jgi:hypothetical protein